MTEDRGSVRKTDESTLEHLEIELALTEEDREAFKKDPEGFMMSFFESMGYLVNGVKLTSDWCDSVLKESSQPGVSFITKCFHVGKGDFASFYFCPDPYSKDKE